MNSRITHSFRIYNSTMKNLFKIYDFWYLAIASAIASFGEWGASLGIIVVISRHFATHQLPVTALPGPWRSQAGRGAGGPGAGQARRPRPPSRSPEPGHRAVTDGFCLSPCGSAGRGRVLRVPGRRHATCMIIRVSDRPRQAAPHWQPPIMFPGRFWCGPGRPRPRPPGRAARAVGLQLGDLSSSSS